MECRICSHPDGGNHYNTITCRACAAFFRRSMQMKMTYRCRKNGNCELNCTISRVNRFSCRYCRLKRCLDIGMELDEDSASSECPDPMAHPVISCSGNDRVPSVEEEEDDDNEKEESEDEHFNPENIFQDVEGFLKETQCRLNSILKKEHPKEKVPYTRSLCQQAAVAYVKHREKWPNCTKEKVFEERLVELHKIVCLYSKEFVHIGEFCMEIQPFTELPIDQRTIVMKKFAKKFMPIDQAFTSVELMGRDPEDSRIIILSGQICDHRTATYDCSVVSEYSEEFLKGFFHATEKKFVELYVKQFKEINPDHFEVMYLLLSAMWDVEEMECVNEETKKKAEEVRKRLGEELNFYYQFERKLTNYACRIYRLNNLVSAMKTIAENRMEDSQVAKTFDLCKIDVNLHDLTI